MNLRRFLLTLLLLTLLHPTPSLAQEANMHRFSQEKYDIEVQNGDHFSILQDGTVVAQIRLWGFDAPRIEEARLALESIMGTGHMLTCEQKQEQEDGTLVMKCMISGMDIGETLARSGYSEFIWASSQKATYGKKLRRLQREAREDGRGVWRIGE